MRTNADILMSIDWETEKYVSYSVSFTPVVWHASLSKSTSRNAFEERFDKEKKIDCFQYKNKWMEELHR